MASKQFHCELCKLSIQDEHSYNNHLLGNKHQLNMHAELVKEKKEKCGVHVSGNHTFYIAKIDIIIK